MNQKYLGPRVIPRNIFEKYIFAEILKKNGFFHSDFLYCNPEVAKPPGILQPAGNNTRKLLEKKLTE